MNTTTTEPGPLLLTKDIKPMRRGSLPFKKRRFPIPWSSFSEGTEEGSALLKSSAFTKTEAGRCNCPLEFPLISKIDSKMDTDGSAGGMAALAMVAAAAELSVGAPKEEADVSSHEVPKKHGFSCCEREGRNQDTFTDAPTSSFTDVLAIAAAELQELEEDAISGSTRSSADQPLLTGPAPNGCHGRTSRNNAYCRRHPGYKGSKYCKLHYQHYVLAGGSDADAVGKTGVDEGEKTQGSPNILNLSKDNPQDLVHHQDKRYTGCPTDIRCKATTTRGRECAYCAVNGKYCYLHADYDTNPPPRRGGAGMGSTASAKTKDDAETDSSSQPKESSPNGTDPSPKRKGTSARRLSTTKNLEKHMADAPYPLLSTLATEKWYQRKVIVSTGPLANHVGLVEKWGNGWVSVRLAGIGLHNRRSFELYLHPGQGSEGGSTSSSLSGHTEMETVEVFDTSQGAKPISIPNLHRSISHDNEIPPTPVTEVNSGASIHEVTPLTSCRVIGIEKHEDTADGSSPRTSSIMFPTCIDSNTASTVPESPIPIQAKTAISGSKESNETNTPQSRFKLSVKSQSKAGGLEIPLAQSLMLAQEGGVSNRKIGLLFGTAALERSRRNTHKPTRYEGAGPTTKHTKKQHRKRTFSEVSEAAAIVNSATLVSSSSDEESSGVPLPMFLV